MIRMSIALTCCLLVLLPAALLRAEPARDAVEIGQRIRIQRTAGPAISGQLVERAGDHVVLLNDAGNRVYIQTHEFRGMQRSVGRGSSAGKGAMIGAGIGFGLGTLMVAGYANEDCSGFCPDLSGAVHTAAALSVVVFSLVGALIGSGIPSENWEPVEGSSFATGGRTPSLVVASHRF